MPIKATKFWGACSCGHCGRNICAGDDMGIIAGEIMLYGHETRNFLDQIDEGPIIDLDDDEGRLEYATNQAAYAEAGLPMFDSDHSEQLSLFN